jgi:hypothetical protein
MSSSYKEEILIFYFSFQTVICPHKLPGCEKVFKLPHSCTHIKISRPKVRVNKDLIE